MATLTVFNLAGKETGKVEASDKVFGVKPNKDLLYQVVLWYQNQRRKPYAHTKTKGEVRGGGAKPWAQKGTGRARHGSIRGPQWRHGGVVHGPRKERDYTSSLLPVKMRRKALAMSLSDKFSSGNLVVVDDLKLPELKTKAMLKVLGALPVKHHSVLFATSKKDAVVEKAARNLQKIDVSVATSLNAEQVLMKKVLVLDTAGVEALVKQLS